MTIDVLPANPHPGDHIHTLPVEHTFNENYSIKILIHRRIMYFSISVIHWGKEGYI